MLYQKIVLDCSNKILFSLIDSFYANNRLLYVYLYYARFNFVFTNWLHKLLLEVKLPYDPLSVRPCVGIFLKGVKFHFHASIEALRFYGLIFCC